MDPLPKISETSLNNIPGILNTFRKHLDKRATTHLGYPYNLSDRIPEVIQHLLDYSLNNLGDPFIESNYGIHSRPFEIAVLDWFAELWNIPVTDYWGYVTGSGTEGNFEGILLGRENFPDGVLYASEDSHYSVFKAARMFRMPLVKVKSNSDGTMDLVHFSEVLCKDKPAIVNVNIGTTMKAGADDLDGIIEILGSSPFYIHCDAALSGIMDVSMLSFEKPISSISVSGHKFLGCPIPCGIILTRKHFIDALSQNIDYINSRDATIMGSRNGHAPIFIWYKLVTMGCEGIVEKVKGCRETAKHLEHCLPLLGVGNVQRNPGSTTVTFARPSEKLVHKWQLACSGNICHIVVMPNVTKETIGEFMKDYLREHWDITPKTYNIDIMDAQTG